MSESESFLVSLHAFRLIYCPCARSGCVRFNAAFAFNKGSCVRAGYEYFCICLACILFFRFSLECRVFFSLCSTLYYAAATYDITLTRVNPFARLADSLLSSPAAIPLQGNARLVDSTESILARVPEFFLSSR